MPFRGVLTLHVQVLTHLAYVAEIVGLVAVIVIPLSRYLVHPDAVGRAVLIVRLTGSPVREVHVLAVLPHVRVALEKQSQRTRVLCEF